MKSAPAWVKETLAIAFLLIVSAIWFVQLACDGTVGE